MPTPDVLVIGGGPAGTATATRLAGMGIRVMLVDSAPAFRAPYDVVISESTIGSLALELPARPVMSLRLRYGGRDSRVVPAPELYSCDQAILRARLIQSAVAAGVTVIDGTATLDGEGFVVNEADGTVFAPKPVHVVIATGAYGLGSAPPVQATGFTYSRVVYGSGRSPETTLYFSTPPPTSAADATTSAWVLRGPGDSCTLTITASNRERSGDQLFAEIVAELATVEPYFAGIRGTCPGIGSFTNLGFSPQTCLDQGRILIGDAAGLTNPFTGEGISYAVQSGEIAASCIARALDDPESAASQYQQEMARTFVGYFETGQHSVRRYQLAWRTMAATLTDDSPFFAKARRAMILPEGPRNVGRQEVELDPADSVLVRAFTATCDSLEVAAIRTEWPFLVRLLADNEGPMAYRLRPAVPFLAAVVAGGSPPPPAAAPVAAGIELATLAVLAFVGSPQAPDQPGRGIDWARAATVLAGDFLFSVASDLVASVGNPSLSLAFADWVHELTALRTGRLRPEGLLRTPAAELFGALFEFPCRAGAELASLSPTQNRQLRDQGYHSGQAFLFAEDLRALHGRPTRLDTTLDNLLRNDVSSLLDLLPGVTVAGDLDRDRADRLLREALANQVARTTLSGLPARSTRILTAFTRALAES